MLKIRLAKTGKRNAPSYRVVVIPEERPRDGEAVEILGYFNPSVEPPSLKIDKKRLQYWLERGAQLTKAVENLIKGEYEFKKYVPKKSRESVDKSQGTEETQEQRPQSEALRPAAVPEEKPKQEVGSTSQEDTKGAEEGEGKEKKKQEKEDKKQGAVPND